MARLGGFIPTGVGGFTTSANMLPIDVTIDPTVHVLVRDFNTFGVNVRSYREPLHRSIKEVMSPSIRRNFLQGGRPVSWLPLAPQTITRRLREGRPPGPPLMKSRKLYNAAGQINIWHIDGPKGEAFIKGLPRRVAYGVYHQGGEGAFTLMTGNIGGLSWEKVPPRPFLVIQQEDLERIADIFDDWIAKRVERDLKARGIA